VLQGKKRPGANLRPSPSLDYLRISKFDPYWDYKTREERKSSIRSSYFNYINDTTWSSKSGDIVMEITVSTIKSSNFYIDRIKTINGRKSPQVKIKTMFRKKGKLSAPFHKFYTSVLNTKYKEALIQELTDQDNWPKENLTKEQRIDFLKAIKGIPDLFKLEPPYSRYTREVLENAIPDDLKGLYDFNKYPVLDVVPIENLNFCSSDYLTFLKGDDKSHLSDGSRAFLDLLEDD
jgi:hypothetical protein